MIAEPTRQKSRQPREQPKFAPAPGDRASEQALRGEVRTFLAEARRKGLFEPQCDAWLTGYSSAFSRLLAQRGWLGMTWPVKYGGHGRPSLERFAVIEELLASGAPVAAHWMAERQTGPLILRYGSESMKRKYLPVIARGEFFVSIGMSEHGSGSDLSSLRTKAIRADGGWLVSGSKTWTSHAHRSHAMVALVRTGESADGHSGLTQMIIPLDAEGVAVSPIRGMAGEPHFCEVNLDKVYVQDEAVIGVVGNGWKQAMSELASERSGPERFLSVFPLLNAWLESRPNDRGPEAMSLGLFAAHLWALHSASSTLSASPIGGPEDSRDAALIKHVGTRLEQQMAYALHDMVAADERTSEVASARELAKAAVLAAPSFTLRGGTTEILQSIIAKSLQP